MAQEDAVEQCVENRLRRFQTYDRAVDVVSAFEALFTQSDDLPPTVVHFERFPTLTTAESDEQKTPDFTIAFDDGTALIGEVSRIALHEESVESLCRQLVMYDNANNVPISSTTHRDIERADVLLLVPADVGPDAVTRIIKDRLEDNDHWYSPESAPCIMQYLFDEGRYVFQRLPIPGNGIPNDGTRPAGLGDWLARSSSIKVKPSFFMGIKAEKAFMNDPPEDLYLATLLWTKVFPLLEVDPNEEGVVLSVKPNQLAELIHERFGTVRSGDVRRALNLLETAQLARSIEDGGWLVGWQPIRRQSQRDVAQVIASRACKPPTTHGLDSFDETTEDADTELRLFSLDE